MANKTFLKSYNEAHESLMKSKVELAKEKNQLINAHVKDFKNRQVVHKERFDASRNCYGENKNGSGLKEVSKGRYRQHLKLITLNESENEYLQALKCGLYFDPRTKFILECRAHGRSYIVIALLLKIANFKPIKPDSIKKLVYRSLKKVNDFKQTQAYQDRCDAISLQVQAILTMVKMRLSFIPKHFHKRYSDQIQERLELGQTANQIIGFIIDDIKPKSIQLVR